MRRTTSGAVGYGLGTTIKYLQSATGIGLGTKIKYLTWRREHPPGYRGQLPEMHTERRRGQRPVHHDQIPEIRA
jgi:hypothetical protein